MLLQVRVSPSQYYVVVYRLMRNASGLGGGGLATPQTSNIAYSAPFQHALYPNESHLLTMFLFAIYLVLLLAILCWHWSAVLVDP